GISRGCLSRCDLRDDRSHHHSQAALPPGASGGSCEPGPLGKPFDARGTRGDSFTSMRITILSPSRKRAIKMSQHIQELRFNFSGLRWIILVFALAFAVESRLRAGDGHLKMWMCMVRKLQSLLTRTGIFIFPTMFPITSVNFATPSAR